MPYFLTLLALLWPLAVWAYPAEVAEVFDGDTLLTTTGEHIRLVNINAPEVTHENKPGQAFGEEAKTELTRLVKGKKIEVKPAPRKRDKYKRTLADIYVGDTWVNRALVSSGHAFVYTFPENSQGVEPLFKAENSARGGRKGLWAEERWQPLPADGSFQDAMIGQFRVIEGRVKNVVQQRDRWYLNFGDNWREDFTVDVPKKFIANFTAAKIDLKDYRGKKLRVRGILKPVNGVLVTATHPAQLEVLP